MSLMARAKADVEKITSNLLEWGKPMIFRAPTGEVAAVNGIHTKRNLTLTDQEGNDVNSKHSYVAVAEKFLTDLAYPVRDSKNQVHLNEHTVEVSDSTGAVMKYKIREWQPDETVGLIVCILQDFEP